MKHPVQQAEFLLSVASDAQLPPPGPPDGTRRLGAPRPGGASAVIEEWLEGGSGGQPYCEARSYHGFQGIDGQVVSAVARFALPAP
jgi:hypothetical protein